MLALEQLLVTVVKIGRTAVRFLTAECDRARPLQDRGRRIHGIPESEESRRKELPVGRAKESIRAWPASYHPRRGRTRKIGRRCTPLSYARMRQMVQFGNCANDLHTVRNRNV